MLFALSLGLTQFGLAQNSVILGNANFKGGHSDGDIFVQGNVSGSSYELNNHNETDFAIYLGGDNNINNFLRANNGFADIRGEKGNLESNASTKFGTIATPDFQSYADLGGKYASLNGQQLDTSGRNNLKVTITDEQNVFSVAASELNKFNTLDFNDGNGNIVINVSGDIVNWGLSVNGNRIENRLIWNFVDASEVNISSRPIRGAVIAPNATVTKNQNIDGFLLAKDWTVNNSTELHYFERADIEFPGVPEPSALVLLSLGGLALIRRKRN